MDSIMLNGRWSELSSGTNAGVTATKAAITGRSIVVDHISGHGDADATLQLIYGGAIILAEWKFDVSLEGFSFHIPTGLWVAPQGQAITAVLSASTSDCQVNIGGFLIP